MYGWFFVPLPWIRQVAGRVLQGSSPVEGEEAAMVVVGSDTIVDVSVFIQCRDAAIFSFVLFFSGALSQRADTTVLYTPFASPVSGTASALPV